MIGECTRPPLRNERKDWFCNRLYDGVQTPVSRCFGDERCGIGDDMLKATSELRPADCDQPTATSRLRPANCDQPTATSQLRPANCD